MPDNIVYVYEMPSNERGRSVVPVIGIDPLALPVRYSLSGNPNYIYIDSAGYFRNRTNLLGITETPVFSVHIDNGLTATTIAVKLRIVSQINVEYLIVAGGGGGGSDMGGGGGGGGILTGNITVSTDFSHGVIVGAGGTGAVAGTRVPRGSNGGSSAIITYNESLFSANAFSASFDGDDYITSSSSINMPTSTAACVEGWFYIAGGSDGPLFTVASGATNVFAIYTTSNFTALNIVLMGATYSGLVNLTGPFSWPFYTFKDRWNHFAIQRTVTGIINVFVNGLGIFVVQNTTGYNPLYVRIGSDAAGSNSPQFYCSNFRFVANTEVYVFGGVNSFPTLPLTSIANTSILLCSTSSVTQDRGNANLAVTNTNSVVSSQFNPFFGTTKFSALPFVVNRLRGNGLFTQTTAPNQFTPIQSNIAGRMYNVHILTSGTITFTVDQAGTDRIEIFMWGGGGAGGRPGGWGQGSSGGAGGAARGELALQAGRQYIVVVGGGGNYTAGTNQTVGGGGSACANGVDNSYGGGGGGLSGIFVGGFSQEGALLIASGGGGGGSSRAGTGNQGGAGGALNGQDGVSPYDGKTSYRGQGGTSSGPGADASSDSVNLVGFQGPLQGGNSRVNSYGGGGGGGWYGGSGGGYSEPNTMGGGGGGSGYISPLIVNGVLTAGSFTTPGDSSNPLRFGNAGNPGGVSGGGTGGLVIIRYPIEPLYNVGGSRIAVGGGAGGTTHDVITTDTRPSQGGSGGGAAGQWANFGNSIQGQGFPGGFSAGQWYPAGGGGATSAGTTNPAHGGSGFSSNILGVTYFWSGGGGGAGYSGFGGNGGIGGGGGGAPRSTVTSTTDGAGDRNGINFAGNGTVGTTGAQTNVPGGNGGTYTGGGGGGGSHYNITNNGGNGGSGMVVIRYFGSQAFFGGNISSLGEYTIHTYTTTGILAGQLVTAEPTGNAIIEGDIIVYNVNCYRIASGTTLYWTVNSISGNVGSGDLAGGGGSGSFVVGGVEGSLVTSGSFAILTDEDSIFEPNKRLVVDVRQNSPSGLVLATSSPVTVVESLPISGANITISTPQLVYNEGTEIVFTLNAAVQNGTTLYWTTTGSAVSGDLSAASGTTTFTNNTATVRVTPVVDSDEILENFVLQLRARSLTSTVFKTSNTIYINSNSSAVITPSTLSMTEEGTVTFSIVTQNIPDNTVVYWENIGTAVSADFTDLSLNGNLVIINNSASFTKTGVVDTLADGNKTLQIRVRAIHNQGLILGTSPVVTILDNGVIAGIDIVMVGGGGGGGTAWVGSANAGGGGAGGMVELFNVNLSLNQVYTVTVGNGGNSGQIGSDTKVTGPNFSRTAMGGGAGGGSGGNGGPGGSGGGGNKVLDGPPGNDTLQFSTYGYGYGNNGGFPGANYTNYGGGGGAGAAGSNAQNGPGGAGRTNPLGTIGGMSGTLAGGGGASTAGGGSGGGGTGASNGVLSTPGTPNTGSGGGGGIAITGYEGGARGGSGLFALRYLAANPLAVGGNIFLDSGYVYHVFTTSGNLTTNVTTVSVTPNVSIANEGSTVSFTVNTTGVANGTTLYWVNTGTISGVTDFIENTNFGTFIINNNTGSFNVTLLNDYTTEASETIVMAIRLAQTTNDLAVSTAVTVIDSSSAISIEIAGNPVNVFEGNIITYNITAPNVPNGNLLYWTNSGTTSAADFIENVNSGSLTVTGNAATLSLTTYQDGGGESNETVIINIRRDSVSGPIIGTANTVTILEGIYSITPSANLISEGGLVTFTFTTANVIPGTYYWTNAGTTNASDFTSGVNSGNVVITGNTSSGTGTLSLTTTSNSGDSAIETIIIQLRSYSTSGPILATSPTVNVEDPSYTISYLLVAGGGGGGRDCGGGGGAGGVLGGSTKLYVGQTYSITVGNGGSGATTTSQRGGQGGNSGISGPQVSIAATGGAGGNSRGTSGGSGGSGGGGAVVTITAGTGIAGQGNNGAPGDGGGGSGSFSGGGGGAGAAGSGVTGGIGTNAYSSWINQIATGSGPAIGSNGYFSGGGGGGIVGSITPGNGGLGGGGNASANGSNDNGGSGGTNTGGGGGGQSSSGLGAGGAGGSGVVVLRRDTNTPAFTLTGGGQLVYNGGWYYYVFTSSGSIIIP